MGNQMIKRVCGAFRIGQNKGSLAEIIAEQGWKRQEIPGNADGFYPEMPHVRIEGFTPGNAENHEAEDEKSMQAVITKKIDGVLRMEGRQNLGPLRHCHDPQAGEDHKPEDHHRTKKFADAAGSMSLGPKKENQNHAGQGHHQGLGLGGGYFETFQRGEDRDNRGNEPVAV